MNFVCCLYVQKCLCYEFWWFSAMLAAISVGGSALANRECAIHLKSFIFREKIVSENLKIIWCYCCLTGLPDSKMI